MKNLLSTEAYSTQVVRFALVGCAAAGVHFCVVLLLVQFSSWQPLLANIIAFLVAFQVSYFGHRSWSFPDTALGHTQSLPRFFLVASGSFVLNEGMYYLLLHYTALPYWLSLGIVLVLVAVITFFSSRLWAFARET